MIGMPITVVLCVFVLTPNVNLPPPFFGIRTSVSSNVSSVLWSTFAFGNAALIAAILAPMPTPRAVAPPSTVMSVTLRGECSVKLTRPFSGAFSLAERVFGPPS